MEPAKGSSWAGAKSVGGYSVIAELGRGGMGVVLLGHDSRLDRRVAIKALTPEFAADPERLARFSREARTLASLSHPNVAQIYGMEEQEGARYIVMEFVDGRPLSALIAEGPLAVEDALDIGAQIAAGVEAAHEQGVIHRDLKPANVVVGADGRAKVLDFGLAREVEGRGSTPDLSNTPTATLARHVNTGQGQIMGTVTYMSPEQARGKPLDRRTDVWSFGCVMYEMLTGQAPFAGETASDVIAAILEREPAWSKLPARTPHRVGELLMKCLEKDQSRRLRDIGDARLELEKASTNREWTTQSLAAAQGGIAGRRRGGGLAATGAVCAIALALGAVGGWLLGGAGSGGAAPGGEAVEEPIRARFVKLTDEAGMELWPSLSPDGRTILYCSNISGNWNIYSQRVGGLNPINLTEGAAGGDMQPAFSPDGERVVFRSERSGGGLFVMGATGESPRRLTDFGFNPQWSPDGRRVVFATESITDPRRRLQNSELWEADVQTGEARRIYEGDAVQPQWSPDGGRIAFWSTVGESGRRDIFTIPVDGGEPVALTGDGPTNWNPVWSHDGRHIYFCSDRMGVMGVWRVAVDERTGAAMGEPMPVTAGGAAFSGYLTRSADGKRLAYSLVDSRVSVWRAPFDPELGVMTGPATPVTRGSYSVTTPALSPDGEWVAFTSDLAAQEDIAIVRADGSERRLLTSDALRDRGPRWSPDGRRIVFYSDRGGEYGVWVMNIDGSGLQLLSPEGEHWLVPTWSHDGKSVTAARRGGTVAILDASEGGRERVVAELEGIARTYPLQWSADGARLVCGRADSSELVIYSAETGEITSHDLTVRGAVGGGISGALGVAWLPDGRRIVVMSRDTIAVYDKDGEIERTNSIDIEDFAGGVSLSADGSWIAFLRVSIEGDVWMIELE